MCALKAAHATCSRSIHIRANVNLPESFYSSQRHALMFIDEFSEVTHGNNSHNIFVG